MKTEGTMRGKAVTLLAVALVVAAGWAAMAGRPAKRQTPPGQSDARSVILFIGDGMGEFELSAARYYQYGAAGRLRMDSMPTRSTATTYAVEESNPNAPNYVPDSASTATAWSTGTKTSNGRISTTARTDEDLVTTMELAKQAGLLTGNVSTATLTDATPAAPMAQVAKRGCEGPTQTTRQCPQDATENGGPGSIAEQSIDLGVDVLLGGGFDRYDETILAGYFAGQTVIESAADRGYTIVTDADELTAVRQLPVLGLFADGRLPTELTGPRAVPGGLHAQCTDNPGFIGGVPTIDEMTAKAIELLDRTGGDRGRANGSPGFFLQVEGASIDKGEHDSQPCQQIGETIAFDRAVGVALNFAEDNGNTTVIVSADHTHTSQIIAAGDNDSPGATVTLSTADGQPMRLNYATSRVTRSQDHTGATVPYLAFGPGADSVGALIDQTDIFDIITAFLRLPVR